VSARDVARMPVIQKPVDDAVLHPVYAVFLQL
jgi:hypothetical protein